MKKFKISYDDQPNEVVNTISSILASFGLEIIETNIDQECIVEYEIKVLK
jgi:hypothetical protein